jgi:hypothetical protein
MTRTVFFFVLIFFICVSFSNAQTSSDPGMISSQFDTTGFPLWAKNLRRGEIIAFGSFPLSYFFANFSFDMYRFATNDWDRRYAPRPLKAAGAIEQTKDEKKVVLGIAAGVAVMIALVDYGIAAFKQKKLEREISQLPASNPIIIRKPMYEDEYKTPATELGETESY